LRDFSKSEVGVSKIRNDVKQHEVHRTVKGEA
jgi:hypothetical protein